MLFHLQKELHNWYLATYSSYCRALSGNFELFKASNNLYKDTGRINYSKESPSVWIYCTLKLNGFSSCNIHDLHSCISS